MFEGYAYNFDPTPFLDKIKRYNYVRCWERIVARLIWSERPRLIHSASPKKESDEPLKGGGVSLSEVKAAEWISYPIGFNITKALKSGTLTRYQSFKIAFPDYKTQGLPRVDGKGYTKFLIQPPNQILKDYVIVENIFQRTS